jgi:pimeloyl-ACP methyl ester carboxylesterase
VHAVAASFPAAQTVVLDRAGHFPWVDEPDDFRAVVAEFLRAGA